LAGKKVILIQPESADNSSVATRNNETFIPTNSHGNKENTTMPTATSSITGTTSKRVKKRKTQSQFLSSSVQVDVKGKYPKSVSIGDVLKAGKLVIPKQETVCELVLEYFKISQQIWLKKDEIKFHIQKEKFAEGGFRNAFKAYSVENGQTNMWVVKKFKSSAWKKVSDIYEMSLEEHTRKQVQMHVAAQSITNRLTKKLRKVSGNT